MTLLQNFVKHNCFTVHLLCFAFILGVVYCLCLLKTRHPGDLTILIPQG